MVGQPEVVSGAAAAAYEPGGVAVLFGGIDANGEYLDHTYIFDGAWRRWTDPS